MWEVTCFPNVSDPGSLILMEHLRRQFLRTYFEKCVTTVKTQLTSLAIGHVILEGLRSFEAPEAGLEKTEQA